MEVVVDGEALPAVWMTAGATHLRHTDAPLATLFDALDVAGVLRVLACLLLGGRVLLVAGAQSLLVLAAEALLELLQPFAWTGPCIYIPVLPAALLDVLDIPSFFLCGVTAATARAIRALPPDVLVVRLDSGDVGAPQPPLPPFPAALEAELRANIRRVLAPQRGRCDSPAWTPRTLPYPDDPDAFNERMQTVFFAFFAHMLQDCRDYVVFQNVVPKPATFFDYESFFRSQSAKDPFLAQFFSESQLFVAFVEQLPWPHGSLFDRAVAARIWELPIDDARRLLFPQNVPVVSVSIELPPPDPGADPAPSTPFRLDTSAIDQIRVKRCPYPIPPKTEPVCPVSGPSDASVSFTSCSFCAQLLVYTEIPPVRSFGLFHLHHHLAPFLLHGVCRNHHSGLTGSPPELDCRGAHAAQRPWRREPRGPGARVHKTAVAAEPLLPPALLSDALGGKRRPCLSNGNNPHNMHAGQPSTPFFFFLSLSLSLSFKTRHRQSARSNQERGVRWVESCAGS